MGVVYYANYLRWFEKGRSELLRQFGLPYAEIEQEGFQFPVVEVTCRYQKPAHYDDTIIIETQLTEISRASLSFSYRIYKDDGKNLAADGTTKHVCVNASGRIVRIPHHLAERLNAAGTESSNRSNSSSRSNPLLHPFGRLRAGSPQRRGGGKR
jgi:acyl-CoA thioester hydrolase